MTSTKEHQPAMLKETIELLSIQPKQWYIDATFGRGGHTQAILEKGGDVLAFDWDHEAVEYGREQFAPAITAGALVLVRASFTSIEALWYEFHTRDEHPAGILFDFGTSSDQLLSKDRGFSFDSDAPLDMRMDDRLGVMAKDLLAVLSEKELTELFQQYGGETLARPIAKRIKRQGPVTTTKQLADIILSVNSKGRGHLHPATKVFQALRIAVNTELENIEQALPQAFSLLSKGGRLVTLAFHEGEDRIAKRFFNEKEQHGQARLLLKRPGMPTEQEIKQNQRARSTKLRALERV